MEIHLIYRESSLGEAWQQCFADVEKVQIKQGDITRTTCDAIVSPANSFGFMDGGLDLALSERFGWDLQQRLQQQIAALPERELLIGQALLTPTLDAEVPWLIAAPTMRVPMSFNIATSVNAYLAMKAVLIAASAEEQIRTVAVPGLCTGVGRMKPEIAARQMLAAYEEVIDGSHRQPQDFGEAQQRQLLLNPESMIWDY